MIRVVLLLLAASGCTSDPASLVGRECNDEHPCPDGLVCVSAENTSVCAKAECEDNSGCPDENECIDHQCLPVSVSTQQTRLGHAAATGRGSSSSFDVRVNIGRAPAASTQSASFRVTGGLVTRPRRSP